MKIIPKNIAWKIARNNNQYAIIDDGKIKHTYWLKQGLSMEDINKLVVTGKEVDVNIQMQGTFSTITKIQGEEILSMPLGQKPTPIQNFPSAPPPSLSKVPSSPQVGTLMERINKLIEFLKDKNLTASQLSQGELDLSILNVEMAQQYSVNYKILKQKIVDTINQLKSNPDWSGKSMTAINAQSERECWMEKVKVTSNEIMMNSINSMLFAIKDRIKHIK